MSRSCRKTPIFGYTTAESDAPWKAKAARVLRHRAKQELLVTSDITVLAGKRWDAVNPWSSEKDGKNWWGKADAKAMRK